MKRASAAIVAVAAAALTLMATASAVAGAVPAQEAGRPADFAWGLPLILDGESGSPAWRVALPLEVYRGLVRADRGDLRVFNARGEVVPYQLRDAAVPAAAAAVAQALPLFALRGDPARALRDVQVRIESGGASVVLQSPPAAVAPGAAPVVGYIVDARALKAPIAALQLRWAESAAQFAGRLEVEASDDLGNWRNVGGGSIANLATGSEHLVENRIELPSTQARYWRLAWSGGVAPFTLDTVLAETASARPDVLRATLQVPAAAAAAEPATWEFDLGAALPVDQINVLLPESNTVVRMSVASRARLDQPWTMRMEDLPLYRLDSPGSEIRNAARNVPAAPARYWRLRLRPSGGALGAAAPTLEVAWPPQELWFIARGPAPFVLAYGSATATPAQTLLDAVIPTGPRTVGVPRVTPRRASPGTRQVLGGEARLVPPPPPFPWRKAILWAVLAGGVLLLGAMALRLMRETRTVR